MLGAVMQVIEYKDLSFGKVVGDGTFGKVYMGTLKSADGDCISICTPPCGADTVCSAMEGTETNTRTERHTVRAVRMEAPDI